jgi:SulP family sulfate permease
LGTGTAEHREPTPSARAPWRPGSGAVSGASQLAGYRRAWLRTDILAGITVTAYLVPQCLAYAGLAGVPPVTGLWVAVIAMIAYGLLGTSRVLSVGPESTTAIMAAAAVAPLAAGDPERYLALAAALAVLVGIVCLAAYALRLGFLADLLSQPILVGFMAGVAVIMIGSQLGTISGVPLTADSALGRLNELAGRLDEIHPATLAVGAGVATFLVVLRRLAPLAPGALLAVVGSAILVAMLGLERDGVALVGPVSGALPTPSLPAVDPHGIVGLLGATAAVTFVAYSDVALTGRAFAARNSDVIDPNREFLALGAANLAAGLTGGFALSASSSRTAIIDAMGGRTQLTGLVAAAAVLVVVLALPGAIAIIPQPALGGVVVFAALRLVDLAGLRRLARFRSSELGLALAATAGVILFDVLAGILIALALSVVELFARVARPPASVLGRVPGLAGLHNVEDWPDAVTIPGLVVFRYDAPLCFANATDFRQHAVAAVEAETTPVEWFLLNAEAIVELDVTAADAMRALHEDLRARGIVFAMARVKQDLLAQLRRGGLLELVAPDLIFPTLPTAVEACARRGAPAASASAAGTGGGGGPTGGPMRPTAGGAVPAHRTEGGDRPADRG